MLKNRKYLIPVFLGLVIFLLISPVNHYLFRTNAFDLGIFNHAIYDYAHFRFNRASLMLGFVELSNLLADHFSILHMAFAPLIYLSGTYTLLLVQVAFLLYGGWGIRRYLSLFTANEWIPVFGQLHFYVSWGVISAVAFDYHDNVIGTMFVPHLLYHAEKKEWKAVVLMSLLIILSRVEMSIWLLAISLSLFAWHFRDARSRLVFASISLLSVCYFLVVTRYLIPSFSKDGYTQLHFSAFGDSPGEIIFNAVQNPIQTIQYLFIDHHFNSEEDFLIKRDFYIAFLVSGGFLVAIRPFFLLILAPILAQKMLHDSTNKWGVGSHYSIETVLIITLSAFSFLAKLKRRLPAYIISALLIIAASATTLYFIRHRNPGWMDTTSENFLKSSHYKQDFDVAELHRALKEIPPDAVVSAQSNIVPHMALTSNVYLTPYVSQAT